MSVRRSVLPAQPSSFVGRRAEVKTVRRTLQRSRLVTVTGIPGVGKTRIALKAADGVRRAFPDGVHVVELSALADPDRLPQAVADALDVPDQPSRDATEVLVDHLAGRQALLVLDTCEHLVEACSRLVQDLLPVAPALHVLATSRQPLGVPGEHSIAVPPMEVPPDGDPLSPAAVAHRESVALFLDRVAAVAPGFSLTAANAGVVAELCRRLEGIPLAIELAAVRMRTLPVERILRLLDERLWPDPGGSATADPRHRTMRAAIAWSHDLCTAEEQALWARVSVFSGGFDLAAAEAVCADVALPADRIFPVLAGLIDKSIVIAVRHGDRTRYRMLDSIREFGAGRPVEPGERRKLLVAHRDHYLALAEAAGSVRAGADQIAQWERARGDWPNIRAALDFCFADRAETTAGLRLAVALWFLWIACGLGREGRHHLARLIGRAAPADRGPALLLLAYIAVSQGDLAAARAAIEECAAAGRPGDRSRLTKMEAILAFTEGDIDTAAVRYEAALAMLAPSGADLPVLLTALVEFGLLRVWQGRIDDAAALLERCRAMCVAHDEFWTRSWADTGLAFVWWARGDAGRAAEHGRAALRLKPLLGDSVGGAICVELLAWLATEQNDPVRAARLLNAAYERWRQVGQPLFGSPHFLSEHNRYMELVRSKLSASVYEAAAAEGRTMAPDALVAYALDSGRRRAGPAPDRTWAPLTPREREVAELVAEGLTNKEIARRLVVARRTADTHVEHILAKLGFTARAQIAAWAARRRDTGTVEG